MYVLCALRHPTFAYNTCLPKTLSDSFATQLGSRQSLHFKQLRYGTAKRTIRFQRLPVFPGRAGSSWLHHLNWNVLLCSNFAAVRPYLVQIAGVDAARTLLADLLSCTDAARGVGELALYWAARAKLEEVCRRQGGFCSDLTHAGTACVFPCFVLQQRSTEYRNRRWVFATRRDAHTSVWVLWVFSGIHCA